MYVLCNPVHCIMANHMPNQTGRLEMVGGLGDKINFNAFLSWVMSGAYKHHKAVLIHSWLCHCGSSV